MRWIGFDPGLVRCGVAVSDPLGILASPVAVLAVEPRESLAQRVAEALSRYGAPLAAEEFAGMVCGLALDQRGREGESARLGRELAELLHRGIKHLLNADQGNVESELVEGPEPEDSSVHPVHQIEFSLHFADERYSTVDMQRRRSEAGRSRRQQKSEIDAWAAAAVLDDFLQRRKAGL